MLEEEQFLAQCDVSVHDRRTLTVMISEHRGEGFWRVAVTDLHASRGRTSATVTSGDGFLMPLIERALAGERAAWQHLAQWGLGMLVRPGLHARPALG